MSKRREKKFPLKVIRGGFSPANETAAAELRERGYRTGDLVFATFKKPRNPRFHRFAHALGGLVVENIEAFEGMDAHKALKRLQWESGVGCDEIAAMVPGCGTVPVRIPQSLSFESMEEGEFRKTMLGLCRWIAQHYWPELEEEQIANMAELMVEESA